VSSVHDEKRLRFTFDKDWKVLKWDNHPAYLGGLQRFRETKAVDFFGLHIGAPWFVEVKDFRGYRIEEAIKRHLLWLNPKVLVTSRSLSQRAAPIPGLTVTSLP
jgi:hypothetical protein